MARTVLSTKAMDEDDAEEDRRQAYAGGQNIGDRAGAFASRVVSFCERWNKNGGVGHTMAPQLVKCATSVAGMLEEARATESRPDFISKCCISLKECREAHRRLQIAERSQIEPLPEARALCAEAGELVAIISAIVRNTKRNSAPNAKRRSRSRIPNS